MKRTRYLIGFMLLAMVVLLIAQPFSAGAAQTTYASDSYGRILSGSWGNADIGGSYSLSGKPSDFNVTGSAGTIRTSPNVTNSVYLNAVSALSFDATFRVSTNKVAGPGARYAYFVARRNNGNDYLAAVRLPSDASVRIQAAREVGKKITKLRKEVRVKGLTHKANSYIRMHVQLTGANPTTIHLRAWADGKPEPSNWQYTATDSTSGLQTAGPVGFRSYIPASSTNGPVVFSFAELNVAAIGPVPTPTSTPPYTPTSVPAGTYTRPFNANSIWNKPISTSGQNVATNSTSTVNLIAADYGGSTVPVDLAGVQERWSAPVYFADASTPKANVCGLMHDGSLIYCTYGLFPVGANFYPSNDSDSRIAVIDTATNRGWSAWDFLPYNKNGINYTSGLAAYGWTDVSTTGDGITMHDGGAWGGRACGLSYLGGLIWPEEIQQGHIDHALAFSVDSTVVSSQTIWWPARGGDGSSTKANAVPYGARIQLDPAFDLTTLPAGAPRVIAKALQDYGAWLVDTGPSFAFYGREFVGSNGTGVDQVPWQNVGVASSYILQGYIPWSAFRVLTEADSSNFYLNP